MRAKGYLIVALQTLLLCVMVVGGCLLMSRQLQAQEIDEIRVEKAEPEQPRNMPSMVCMPEISAEKYNCRWEDIGIKESSERDGQKTRSDSENSLNLEVSPEQGSSLDSQFDPRERHLVSGVRNQGDWGLCWVYSALAAAESALIRQGYASSDIDLSELHALYFDWKLRANCPLTTYCNLGGVESQIFEDMKRFIGPVSENRVPMREIRDDLVLAQELKQEHLYELKDIYGATMGWEEETRNHIKQMILNYGGLCMGMYYDARYLACAYSSTQDTAYYLPANVKMANHTAEIVGWDDAYPAENFRNLPPENGAWLVKNSFGTQSQNPGTGTGYMWISYYDGGIDGLTVAGLSFVRNGSLITQITTGQETIALPMGTGVRLKTETVPKTAIYQDLVYSSSDERVAQVDSTGFIRPISNGDCEIEIRAKDGLAKASCKVHVFTYVTQIQVQDIIRLVPGMNYEVLPQCLPEDASDKRMRYEVADAAIAKVSDTGLVTGLKEGETTLTIEALDGSRVKRRIPVIVSKSKVLKIEPEGFLDKVQIGPSDRYPLQLILRFRVTATDQPAVRRIQNELRDADICKVTGGGADLRQEEDGTYGYSVVLLVQKPGKTSLRVYGSDAWEEGYETQIEVLTDNTASGPSSGTPSTGNVPGEESANGTLESGKGISDCQRGHQPEIQIQRAGYNRDGYRITKCSRCGQIVMQQVIPGVYDISLAKSEYVYNGKKKKPNVLCQGKSKQKLTISCDKFYSSNQNVGKARVKISCDTEEYAFCVYRSFLILPPKTGFKSIKQNGQKLRLTFKKISGQVDGYEIQYATSKRFPKSSTKKIRQKGKDKTWINLQKLSLQRKFYFRIRSYKRVSQRTYYSSWSAVRTFYMRK